MKISGGRAGGLRIETPPGDRTRPSTDRLRESLFAILSPRLEGARVLDLFAGSGSLGLEAASRGAEEVWWVERNGRALGALKRNIAKLDPAGVRCVTRPVRADVSRFLARPPAAAYDLILMDPPYAEVEKPGALHNWLHLAREGGWLAPEGVLTVESDKRFVADEAIPGWECARRKTYGGSAVTFWRLSASA